MTKLNRWSVFRGGIALKTLISAIMIVCMVCSVQGSAQQIVNADFSGTPLSGNIPLVVSFSDLSTGAVTNTTWHWVFGDGSGSISQNPIAHYLFPGLFSVNLTVSADEGNDTMPKADYIEVKGPKSPAAFNVEDPYSIFTVNQFFGVINPATGGFTAEFYVFADCVTEETQYSYDFGDGSAMISSDPEITHLYTVAGVYSPSVMVIGSTCNNGETQEPIFLPMNLMIVEDSGQNYWLEISEVG